MLFLLYSKLKHRPRRKSISASISPLAPFWISWSCLSISCLYGVYIYITLYYIYYWISTSCGVYRFHSLARNGGMKDVFWCLLTNTWMHMKGINFRMNCAISIWVQINCKGPLWQLGTQRCLPKQASSPAILHIQAFQATNHNSPKNMLGWPESRREKGYRANDIVAISLPISLLVSKPTNSEGFARTWNCMERERWYSCTLEHRSIRLQYLSVELSCHVESMLAWLKNGVLYCPANRSSWVANSLMFILYY